jgi:MtrB/PioB family decaheme-associated outer membrane protein
MTRLVRHFDARPTVLVLALLAAYGPTRAQSVEAKPPESAENKAPAGAETKVADKAGGDTAPASGAGVVSEGSVNVGVTGISGSSADRAQFGQYNGLRNVGNAAGILGIDYYRRDDEAGSSLLFNASNLLLETRQLELLWKTQGNWKLSADYNEQVHYDPYSVNTGTVGFGSTTPQVMVLPGGPGTGSDVDLKVNRTSVGLGLWKSITPALNLEVSLKSEDRSGTRAFGNGFTCPSSVAPGCQGATSTNTGSAVLMLAEPIDSNTTQIDARLSYVGEKLNLSAGYYGSFYKNSNSILSPNVPGSLNNPVGTLLPLNTGLQALLNNPLALPPDNQAQFLDLTGNYALTDTTHLKFKLSYSQATQDQSFNASGLTGAPTGVANLGGQVNTTMGMIGITARPIPKLSLLADYRYEDKSDQTPLALYNVQGSAPNTLTSTNMQLPLTTQRARLEAAYQFSKDYRGTLDATYSSINRGVFTPTSAVEGVSALRQTTDESGVRAELRRTMSESLSGALSIASTRRSGSDWLKPNSGTGVTVVTDPGTAFGPAAIFMPTLADAQRNKVKLTVNWQASEELALQFLAEGGKDKFSSPTAYQQGLQNAGMDVFSIDFDYTLSDKWRINGYLTQSSQTQQQSRFAGYNVSFKDTNTAAALGFTGKPDAKLEVGGNLAYMNDSNAYPQTLDATAPPESTALLAATGGLPNVAFRQATLTLFGKYEIDKQSALRVNVAYQRSYVNDWMWGYNGTPFAYSDGTTLYQQRNQSVGLVGVSYLYRF